MYHSGDIIDQYRLLDTLGSGAYGVVFKAENLVSKQVCALKVISLCGCAGGRELCALRQYHNIKHPHLLKVYHSGIAGDYLYYTMDLADGKLADQHLSPSQLRTAAAKLADALATLHKHGLLHRDIKPDNLFFQKGEPLIGDIGLVTPDCGASLTGTPGFLLPEVQKKGIPLSEQSDLYALAKSFYCLLSGNPPAEYPQYTGPIDPDAAILLQVVLNVCDNDGVISSAASFRDFLLTGKMLHKPKKMHRLVYGIAGIILLFLISVGSALFIRQKSSAASDSEDQINASLERQQPLPYDAADELLKQNLVWDLPDGVKLEMVYCRRGSFLMGCSPESPEAQFSAKQHTEKIDAPYLIGKYEVTQEQYRAVMGTNPSYFQDNKSPVEMITCNEAKAFCSKLNQSFAQKLPRGYIFTLPTEAEWEWAAYGCDEKKEFVYSGSNDIDQVAWYRENAKLHTHNVGLKQPNQLGIYDMSGNVFERCFSTKMARLHNWEANSCRGGAWGGDAIFCRPAANAADGRAIFHVGFRVVIAPIQ